MKNLTREQILNQRKVFANRGTASKQITLKLLSLEQVKLASCIATYSPFNGEVMTELFFATWGLKADRMICYPRVVDQTKRQLQFYAVNSLQDLKADAYGILAPNVLHCAPVDHSMIDVVLVPGVAFDKNNRHRLGMGLGFYDRVLATMPQAYKIALAYDFQLQENLPVDAHDVPMDLIVSESEII